MKTKPVGDIKNIVTRIKYSKSADIKRIGRKQMAKMTNSMGKKTTNFLGSNWESKIKNSEVTRNL
jgi:hypothetical protein